MSDPSIGGSLARRSKYSSTLPKKVPGTKEISKVDIGSKAMVSLRTAGPYGDSRQGWPPSDAFDRTLTEELSTSRGVGHVYCLASLSRDIPFLQPICWFAAWLDVQSVSQFSDGHWTDPLIVGAPEAEQLLGNVGLWSAIRQNLNQAFLSFFLGFTPGPGQIFRP